VSHSHSPDQAGLGDNEGALTQLDSAMWNARADVHIEGRSTFDGLRADPRFERLLKRVGFT